MAKKIHRNDIIGQSGVNLIERITLEMGFLWHPTKLEAGIDGIIEIRDSNTGVVTNSIIQVQSKATEQPFQNETEDTFDFTCEERDLDYWMHGNAPVILIRSRPVTQEAYWVSIKDYFADRARQTARKIRFNKRDNRFDVSCRSRLASLALRADSGVYLSPLPKNELLTSNLLSVESLPTHLYRAQTEFRHRWQLFGKLASVTEHPSGDWAMYEDAVISFHDLSKPPWSHVIIGGSTKRSDTSGWTATPDRAIRSVFVQLLNRCLSDKARMLGLKWSRAKEWYFVEPSPNLTEKTFGRRTIFGPYMYKKQPDRVAYYRHSAFFGQFCCFEGRWYLEISPSYYFTRDGHTLDAFHEDRLKGIKRLERNNAVAGQLAMWAEFLRQNQEADLLSKPYPFLKFDDLKGFNVDFGILDDVWLPPARAGEDQDERRLFDL